MNVHTYTTPPHTIYQFACFYFVCMFVCQMCMFVTVYLVPTVSRRGCQITELGLQMVVRILDSFS